MQVAKDQIKSFVERIERLTEEKKALADDIRDVYAEAKANGYDVKALREIIKRRTWEADKLREHDAIVETYMGAMGMLFDTPLGTAGLDAALATNNAVSRRTTDERMKAHANLSQEMANAGFISQEAATENKAIAAGMIRKFGTGNTSDLDIPPELDRRTKREAVNVA